MSLLEVNSYQFKIIDLQPEVIHYCTCTRETTNVWVLVMKLHTKC